MNFNLSILTEIPLETQTPHVCFWSLGEEREQQFLANPHLGLNTSSYDALLLNVPKHRSTTPVSH